MQPTNHNMNVDFPSQVHQLPVLEKVGDNRKKIACNTQVIEAAALIFKKVEIQCPGIRLEILESMQKNKSYLTNAKSCLDHLTSKERETMQEAYNILKVYDPSSCIKS